MVCDSVLWLTVTSSCLLEYSLIPEVLQYKLPITNKGRWVSVPGARRVRALNKRDFFHLVFYEGFYFSPPLS